MLCRKLQTRSKSLTAADKEEFALIDIPSKVFVRVTISPEEVNPRVSEIAKPMSSAVNVEKAPSDTCCCDADSFATGHRAMDSAMIRRKYVSAEEKTNKSRFDRSVSLLAKGS